MKWLALALVIPAVVGWLAWELRHPLEDAPPDV